MLKAFSLSLKEFILISIVYAKKKVDSYNKAHTKSSNQMGLLSSKKSKDLKTKMRNAVNAAWASGLAHSCKESAKTDGAASNSTSNSNSNSHIGSIMRDSKWTHDIYKRLILFSNYANDRDPNIQARLETHHLWHQFATIGTEMIITKSGR
jgi:hypothetical protein